MARGGGGACRMPSEEEVAVAGILLNLPKLISKYEILSQFSFTWGSKKIRSFLPSPLNQRPVDEGLPEKVTAAEATQSPSTPFCFLPPVGKNLKRKATVDLMERYNGIEQEREIVVKEVKPMETHHQEFSAQNMEFIAKRQKKNSMQQQMMMMENDLRARRAAAADARKRRMLKLKVTAAETTQSPSTPFCFLPSVGKNLKGKATVDLMERYNGIEQEREIVVKEVNPMETHHQDFSAQNMEFIAKRQKINYSRSIADFQSFQLQSWNNSMQQQMMTMKNDLRARRAAAADARKRRMLKLKQDKYNSLLSLNS